MSEPGNPTREERPWARVRELIRPRATRGTLGVAVLCAALGFATVVQVRASGETVLERSRRTDLVQILDEVSQRADRLELEAARLEATRDDLLSGASRRQTALEQARAREQTLAVLAGTVPVSGPGIVLILGDPEGRFGAAGLLSAVQELRSADAEAIAIAGANGRAVRVVVSTAFVGSDTGAVVGGVDLTSPYRITAIGDTASLAGAMRFPRGVIAQVTGDEVGGTAGLQERTELTIEVVAPAPEPTFASPAPAAS